MTLPYVLQAELDSLCEMGVENYIKVTNRRERRQYVEDGLLAGIITTGLAYVAYRMDKVPLNFLPLPFFLSLIGGGINAYQKVGENDEEHHKKYNDLCGGQNS